MPAVILLLISFQVNMPACLNLAFTHKFSSLAFNGVFSKGSHSHNLITIGGIKRIIPTNTIRKSIDPISVSVKAFKEEKWDSWDRSGETSTHRSKNNRIKKKGRIKGSKKRISIKA
jgi:hypothetical protein